MNNLQLGVTVFICAATLVVLFKLDSMLGKVQDTVKRAETIVMLLSETDFNKQREDLEKLTGFVEGKAINWKEALNKSKVTVE